MPQKLAKCIRAGGGFRAEDGSSPSGWIAFEVVEGSPVLGSDMLPVLWYWDADPTEKRAEILLPPPKDMTDAQIAADPLFPLIQRATKALRTFGPTSKRPVLDASDKGFAYVDNTLNVTIWWYGTNWRDAMGAIR